MEFPTIPGVLCGLRFFDDIREVKPITAKHAKKGSKRTQGTVSSNYGTHGHSGRHTKGAFRIGI
jgi:hypothetical protein